MNNKETEEIIEDPLGDDDIKYYLPNAKVLKYSELENYKDIDDLLPNNKDFAVILYEDSPNKGHWTTVLKYEPYLEFFDSYGGYPDTQLGWVPCPIRKELKQTKPLLTDLFNKSNYDIVYNPIKYQRDNSDVNTCGRHCVFRILNLVKGNKNLSEYYRLMKLLKNETKEDYDTIISNIINKL